MNELIDIIICADSSQIQKFAKPNSVDLSIVIPPYVNLNNYYKEKHNKKSKQSLENKSERYFDFVVNVIDKIAEVTKPGGVCCLILSNDKDEDNAMIPTSSEIFSKISDKNSQMRNWNFEDKILWIKAPRKTIENLSYVSEGILVDYEQTPFSDIYVLVKQGLKEEFPLIVEIIENLSISESKKQEMLDGFWCIQPSSEKGFKDSIPKELLLRLIMLFSDEGDLVLDPFAEHGITAIAASILKRHFLCIEKDSKKTKRANERFQKLINQRSYNEKKNV